MGAIFSLRRGGALRHWQRNAAAAQLALERDRDAEAAQATFRACEAVASAAKTRAMASDEAAAELRTALEAAEAAKDNGRQRVAALEDRCDELQADALRAAAAAGAAVTEGRTTAAALVLAHCLKLRRCRRLARVWRHWAAVTSGIAAAQTEATHAAAATSAVAASRAALLGYLSRRSRERVMRAAWLRWRLASSVAAHLKPVLAAVAARLARRRLLLGGQRALALAAREARERRTLEERKFRALAAVAAMTAARNRARVMARTWGRWQAAAIGSIMARAAAAAVTAEERELRSHDRVRSGALLAAGAWRRMRLRRLAAATVRWQMAAASVAAAAAAADAAAAATVAGMAVAAAEAREASVREEAARTTAERLRLAQRQMEQSRALAEAAFLRQQRRHAVAAFAAWVAVRKLLAQRCCERWNEAAAPPSCVRPSPPGSVRRQSPARTLRCRQRSRRRGRQPGRTGCITPASPSSLCWRGGGGRRFGGRGGAGWRRSRSSAPRRMTFIAARTARCSAPRRLLAPLPG
ncbi:unnamed protein product [Phaeothamnion confervicola]